MQKNEEITREINESEYERYLRNTKEGIYSIHNLDYTIDEETGFVNVTWFDTEYKPNMRKHKLYDLRNGPLPYNTTFGLMRNNRRVRGATMPMKLL
jgi:hypothetical protein